VALPLETLVTIVRFAVGAAIVAIAILASRGGLRMLLSGELPLLLRGALSMPGILAESEDSFDGPQTQRTASIVYCRSDGRARIAVDRPLLRH